jgi:hypothetical protein
VVVGWMERKEVTFVRLKIRMWGKRSEEITSAGVANEIHREALHDLLSPSPLFSTHCFHDRST